MVSTECISLSHHHKVKQIVSEATEVKDCLYLPIKKFIPEPVLQLKGLSAHLADHTDMKVTTNYLRLKKQTPIVIETKKENVIL